MKKITLLTLIVTVAVPIFSQTEICQEPIFPFQQKHAHGSSIVEQPNGDLLACWFYGSGERTANDVLVQGARLKKGESEWSAVFIMADTPNLPDCNPVLFIDENEQLWLFWIAVRANGWENSILRYKTSTNYQDDGPPVWAWQDIIVLTPGERFYHEVKQAFEANVDEPMWAEYASPYSRMIIEAATDKEKRQKGWMTRIHPTVLPNGRILLPLYSDGFNVSLVAISDDVGRTWHASTPIVGLGPIQPTIVRKTDGSLVAYLRDSGSLPCRAMKSISVDDGETWSFAKDTDILNPGSSLEVITLKNGNWIMLYNDTEDNRRSFIATLSDDEGKSWKWERHIGRSPNESYSYPSVLQTSDEKIHVTYTHSNPTGKTIMHAEFSEEWIKAGD
ncbi:MAG: exo-alpha-sialidase [Candidatus Marinimicrobia bacterium]|nr:exo-alpha-sialidase [Candidatus Neomarinimicrobiota bacterium]